MRRIAILVTFFAVGAARAAVAPPVDRADLARIDEAFRLAATLGPRVWPGFAAGDAPVVFISGAFEYVLNSDTTPDGFQPTPQQFRGKPVFARPRTFPPNLEASFPAIGRDAVVIGTPEATGREPGAWTLVFCHELFHVYQRRHGMDDKIASLAIGPRMDAMWQLNYPFPYDDAHVVRALHLLGHEMFLAIGAADDASYRSGVIREALDNVIDTVDASGKPKDAAYLKFVITNEGVARYFEYRLAHLAATEYPDAYARAWSDTYAAMPNQIKHLGRVSRSRSELYNLGLGLALLLDRLEPGWQSSYFDPGVWLDDLYRKAVPATSSTSDGSFCRTTVLR